MKSKPHKLFKHNSSSTLQREYTSQDTTINFVACNKYYYYIICTVFFSTTLPRKHVVISWIKFTIGHKASAFFKMLALQVLSVAIKLLNYQPMPFSKSPLQKWHKSHINLSRTERQPQLVAKKITKQFPNPVRDMLCLFLRSVPIRPSVSIGHPQLRPIFGVQLWRKLQQQPTTATANNSNSQQQQQPTTATANNSNSSSESVVSYLRCDFDQLITVKLDSWSMVIIYWC